MTDAPDDTPQPVWFSARFPRESRFAGVAGQLAVRVAQSSGYAVDAAQEIGRAVDGAVQQVLRERAGRTGALELCFEADERSFDVRVSGGHEAALTVSRPRPR